MMMIPLHLYCATFREFRAAKFEASPETLGPECFTIQNFFGNAQCRRDFASRGATLRRKALEIRPAGEGAAQRPMRVPIERMKQPCPP